MTQKFIQRMLIIGFLFLCLVITLSSCNTPITAGIEASHDMRDIEIAKEKTKQLEYLWRIDSLKNSNK